MKFKKFLTTGVLIGLSVAVIGNAMGNTVSQLNKEQVSDTQISAIYEDAMSHDDFMEMLKNDGFRFNNEKTNELRLEIASKVAEQGHQMHLNKVENMIKQEFGSQIDGYKISYSFGIPGALLAKGVRNDTSMAVNGFKANGTCEVDVRLNVDNHGRLFESSELGYKSASEISAMTDAQINNVIKEVVAHEVSHCKLSEQIKSGDFKLNLSDTYKQENKDIANSLTTKFDNIVNAIKADNKDDMTVFDYLAFINYHENFADVNAAFMRLGDGSKENVDAVKAQLVEVAKIRHETSSMYHKTSSALQDALEKVDFAAKLTPKEREDLAHQIAGENLMHNMKGVFAQLNPEGDKIEDLSYFVKGKIDLVEVNGKAMVAKEGSDADVNKMYDILDGHLEKGVGVGKVIIKPQELEAKHTTFEVKNATSTMDKIEMMRTNLTNSNASKMKIN